MILRRRGAVLDLLPRCWGLVKTSDLLYVAIAQEVEHRIGCVTRRLTWQKINQILMYWPEVVSEKLCKQVLRLEVFVVDVQFPKDHIGEVSVLVRLPLCGPALHQEFIWSQLITMAKRRLPGVKLEGVRLDGGGLRLEVLLTQSFLPIKVTLPASAQFHGNGQRCYVTQYEFVHDQFTAIR